MDKYEYRVKLDEINGLVDNQDYEEAMKVADTIDWRRVKSARTLCMVGEIYEANKKYVKSREILLLAYERAPIGKTVLYRLVELAVKMGELDEAVEYYNEFVETAPNDNNKYILKYKIYRARRSPVGDQIAILEEYKSHEYTERWSYELARLYAKAGMIEKCIEECDDLILWFSEGRYVIKAMELKMTYTPLSPLQMDKYQNRFHTAGIEDVVLSPAKAVTSVLPNTAPVIPQTAPIQNDTLVIEQSEQQASFQPSIENQEGLQNKIAQGIRDVFAGKSTQEESEALNEELQGSIEEQHTGEILQEDLQEETEYSRQEETKDYVVKDLEPEYVGKAAPVSAVDLTSIIKSSSVIEPGDVKVPEVKHFELPEEFKRTPEEEANRRVPGKFNLDNYDVDIDAIIAETTNNLAQEVSGDSEEESKDKPEANDEMQKELAESVSAMLHEDTEEETPVTNKKESADLQEPDNDVDSLQETEHIQPKVEERDAAPVLETSALSSEAVSDVSKYQIDDILSELEALQHSSRKRREQDKPSDSPKEVSSDVQENAFNTPTDLSDTDMLNEKGENHKEESDAAGEALNSEAEQPDDANEPDDTEANGNSPAKLSGEQQSPVEAELSFSGPEQEAEEDLGITKAIDLEAQLMEALGNPDSKKSVLQYDFTGVEKESFVFPDEPEKVRDEEGALLRHRLEQGEQKKLFTYFTPIPGMREQIVETLDIAQESACDKTSKTGNIVIMGRQGTGKTRMSEGMIKAICKERRMEAAKVAYIVADEFNQKVPAEIVTKLAGGFLVIEKAGSLRPDVVEDLSHAMEFRTDGLTVILEDEKPDMRALLHSNEDFAEKFNASITIPVFTNDELVAFAKTYASEMGYHMDEMGVLALYTMIGDNQTEDEPVTVGQVKEMMDNAIYKAEKGTRKLGRKIAKRHVDENNKIILYEKDFDV